MKEMLPLQRGAVRKGEDVLKVETERGFVSLRKSDLAGYFDHLHDQKWDGQWDDTMESLLISLERIGFDDQMTAEKMSRIMTVVNATRELIASARIE